MDGSGGMSPWSRANRIQGPENGPSAGTSDSYDSALRRTPIVVHPNQGPVTGA